jgi:hypothetical protein
MGTNTGIGIGIGIPFKNNVLGEGKPYLPPEIKDSLKAVVIAYGKTNNDSDRAIVKNLVDASNPFVISNAAFKLNSGFGKYSADFESFDWAVNISQKQHNKATISLNGRLCNHTAIEVDEMKVNIIGNVTELIYWYIANPDDTTRSEIRLTSGINTLPKSYAKDDGQTYNIGFAYISGDSEITIEQIPSFAGAFVTDGVNDLITSTKTVQEMLGGSNEFTVVSMMANLDSVQMMCNSNYNNTNGYNPRNTLEPNGVISMLGYTDKNGTTNNLNLIMGDKDSIKLVDNVNFNSDYVFYPAQYYGSYYKAAWYWTVIANKVLTTDEINQVIAYFNLDRTLKPDILCNIGKQGITNDNHADFNDKLIDYSGNGRDIQMNNLAWKGGSGIAAKPFETIKDYTILSDEARQELTIYNEFSYKVKSNTPNHYWIVQSIIKDNTSYQVTIITDKDCYWINSTSFTNNEGNKESIRKEYPVKANTPTQVTICGLNEFEYPEDIEPTTAVSYVNLNYAGEVTVTFIPSCKGGLLLDGVNDFGKVTGMPVYKDYTVVADYERLKINIGVDSDSPILSKSESVNLGAFMFNTISSNGDKVSYSFGRRNIINADDTIRKIFYQSKYINDGQDINIESTFVDSDKLWLGTYRDSDYRFIAAAIYSLMSFPYSMSKFLIERQLKKYKLGTLYPDMVEFRPIIKANANYKITYYQIDSTNTWKSIKVGDYIVIGAKLAFQITFDNDTSELKEVVSPQLSGIIVEKRPSNPGYNIYSYIASKSPQKINITIDEYIRYEDIVQPYPTLLRFNDENGNEVSWGGKFRVGSTITRIGSAADSNLLPNIYNIFGLLLNDNQVTSSKVIVEKTMVFKAKSAYIFDNNEPKCILSPRLLRIPNSSYKILGYIPDISGHGNNGVIHNSAYAEGSGVNEDGSYQFDGVDDFVTIPTTVGGKQVLMKVNWNSLNHVLYDQRNNAEAPFCIVAASGTIAYNQRNVGGNTYIDGILNNHILVDDLQAITHNIVLNNDCNVANSNSFIGTNYTKSIYAKMSLYDFMLFDDISTDDKIKELNEYVGVEAKVELPPYYWDTYGKTNSDADRDTIQQRGVAVGDYDLINYNHAYEGMSGYNGYPVVFGANKTWEILSSVYSYISDVTSTTIHVTMVKNAGTGLLFSYVKKDGALTNIKEIPAFRVTVKGLEGNSKFGYRYLATEDATKETLVYLGNGTHELAKSFAPTEALLDLTSNAWVGIFITPMVKDEAVFDCDITIEVLPEYKNGLVYDAITDYSKNANIPALDDFTAIIKREWLKKQGCPLIKGSKVYEGGNGNALLLEWDKAYNFVFYKRTDIMEGELPDNISFITPTNYNGNVITRGSEQDTNGICIAGDGNAGFANMVFYKLILYPKTIPLLQIKFLKNLMERDEIIDLNNPIFIKNE